MNPHAGIYAPGNRSIPRGARGKWAQIIRESISAGRAHRRIRDIEDRITSEGIRELHAEILYPDD